MTQDYRIKMAFEELQRIEPFDDPDFLFYNHQEALIDPIFDQVNKPKKEEIIFQELTKGQQYCYSIVELLGQVHNGGIGQYFFNQRNKFIEFAIEGLNEIGCVELSRELAMTNNFYLDNKLELDKLADNDNFSEYLSYFHKSSFQRLFFDQIDMMQKKMIEYVESNSSDFIVD